METSTKSAKKKGATIDDAIRSKIQFKLKAAVYGTDPYTFFKKFDKDGGGSLDHEEFRKLMRLALKIPPRELSDKDIRVFCNSLDDDGSGDLDIEELADFVGAKDQISTWTGVENNADDRRQRKEIGTLTAAESEPLQKEIFQRTGFVAPAYKDHGSELDAVRVKFFETFVASPKGTQEEDPRAKQPFRPDVRPTPSSFGASPLRKRPQKSLDGKSAAPKSKGKPRAAEDAWQFEKRSAAPPSLPVMEEISEEDRREARRGTVQQVGASRRKSSRPEVPRSNTKGAKDDYNLAKDMLQNVIDPALLIVEDNSIESSTVCDESIQPMKTDEDILCEILIRDFGVDPGFDPDVDDSYSEVSTSELKNLFRRDLASRSIEAASMPARRKIMQKFAKDHPMVQTSFIEEVDAARTLVNGGEKMIHSTGITIRSIADDDNADFDDSDDDEEEVLTLASRRTEFDSRSLYTTMRAYREHRDEARIGDGDALLAYVKRCEQLRISPLPLMDYFVYRPVDAKSRAAQFAKMKISNLPESFTMRRSNTGGRRAGGAVGFAPSNDDGLSVMSGLSVSSTKPTNPYGVPIGGRCAFAIPRLGIGDKSAFALASFLESCNLQLIELDLSYNAIGDVGGYELMKIIPKIGKTLTKLDLSHNLFGRRTMAAMRKAFPLKKEGKELYPHLQELLFERSNLNDRCCARIFRSLAAGIAPWLKKLDISGNEMARDTSAIAELLLADRLNGTGCPLEELDVSWLKLNLVHITAVGEAVGQNARLKTLNISYNNFSTEDSIRALATSLLTNIQLTALDLSYNHIDERCAVVFAHMLFDDGDQCSVNHLVIDGNPIGANGAHLFIKEESERGRHISCQDCDFHMSSTVVFNPHNPDGRYELNLAVDYERTVAKRLCSITHSFQVVPGIDCWKEVVLNGKKYSPPIKRLVYPVESEDDVGKFVDPPDGEEIPKSGMLVFVFAMQKPHKAPDTTAHDFGKHLKLFDVKDEKQAARALVELSKGNAYTCKQATALLQKAHDSEARVTACANFIVQLEDRENIDVLLSALNIFEQKLCKKRLGILYYFNRSNPTGHYKMNLEDEFERRVMVQLMDINRLEREDAKERKMPDLSENGDREYFRRMTVDKMPVNYRTNQFLLPIRGMIEFDYISPKRPPDWAEEMDDQEFEHFYDKYILLDDDEDLNDPEEAERVKVQAREVFMMLDDDGSGAIEVEEVQKAFKMLGIEVSVERAQELIEEVDDDGSGEVEIDEFLQLWIILSKEDDRFNMINRLKHVAPDVFISGEQLARMLRSFRADPQKQVETFTIFFGRIVDEENMHLAHKAVTPQAWKQLQKRFGKLFLFSPFRPDGYYAIDLEVHNDYLLARFLISCAMEEPQGFKQTLFEERFNGMGFELNQTWINEGPPHRGRYEVTYRSSRKPSLLGRRRVAERELGWEFPEDFGYELNIPAAVPAKVEVEGDGSAAEADAAQQAPNEQGPADAGQTDAPAEE